MSENLREQTFQAMKAAWRDRAMSVSFDVTWRAVTDAAWEVVGPELDRLRAEVERQARLLDSAYRFGDERGSDLLALSAERDVLRARLAKVGEVLTEWGALSADGDFVGSIEDGEDFAEAIQESGAWRFVRDLRAALASVPEPSDSEPAPDADREAGGE